MVCAARRGLPVEVGGQQPLYLVAMDIELTIHVGALLVGIGATLFMDIWSLLAQRAFGIPAPNYCLVGRWVATMPSGRFRHASIAASPRKRWECALGWIAHYGVGVAYARVFVVLASDAWLAQPRLLPALLFGAVTLIVPFFVMQPAFGLGMASSKTPHPAQARIKSLLSHAAFGVGLYASAIGVGRIQGWL
jgi:Protein of unknown function (DUF2938)